MSGPWKHRSENMRCKTCMWFVPKELPPSHGDPLGQRESQVGHCRRHAPSMSGYPVVFLGDWCGDHRLNELALPAPRKPIIGATIGQAQAAGAVHRVDGGEFR